MSTFMRNAGRTDPALLAALKAANEAFDRMTPEQQAAMRQAQRESWMRGMMPFGHDMTPEQRRARIIEIDAQIAAATRWGAALSELGEERADLMRFEEPQP